ncbi:hypothetical protein, partial [Solirhodobacter olei]|uniref:hypothetical protein n=1 Tax=Solirhodobacter olei TaxID=2493082 RepID=UPI0019D420F7
QLTMEQLPTSKTSHPVGKQIDAKTFEPTTKVRVDKYITPDGEFLLVPQRELNAGKTQYKYRVYDHNVTNCFDFNEEAVKRYDMEDVHVIRIHDKDGELFKELELRMYCEKPKCQPNVVAKFEPKQCV